MENSINTIENKKEPKPFLNDWDKKYLEKGTLGMIEKIYNNFDHNFPDIVLLPERGARPLYYLLDPIFKKFNTEKNTKIPKIVYFSVGKKAGINLRLQEEYHDIKTSDDLMNRLMDDYSDLTLDTIQKLVDKEKVEEVMMARKNMKERALELQEKISEKDLQIAIVDEVLSNGVTIQEIRKAFNNEEIPAYTLVSLPDGHSDLTESGYRFSEKDEKNPNPHVKGYSFSFEYAEDAIGIEKSIHNKYSSLIKKEDPIEDQKLAQDKKQLRYESIVIEFKI